MTEVEYSEQAVDQLEDLEADIAERILNKVDEATDWTEHHLDRLTGTDSYKLRIGDYRAIINWDKEKDVLFVTAVAHRDVVYDRYL